jgi:hypothetical protein
LAKEKDGALLYGIEGTYLGPGLELISIILSHSFLKKKEDDDEWGKRDCLPKLHEGDERKIREEERVGVERDNERCLA